MVTIASGSGSDRAWGVIGAVRCLVRGVACCPAWIRIAKRAVPIISRWPCMRATALACSRPNGARDEGCRFASRRARCHPRQIAEEGIAKDGRKQYVLAGKRGARYGTMRNAKNPDIMFLINLQGFGIPAGFQGTYLTDASGKIEIAEILWVGR